MHIDYGFKEENSGIFILWKMYKSIKVNLLFIICSGVNCPHLSYGICLWDCTSKTNTERLFRMQKRTVFHICNINRTALCRLVLRVQNNDLVLTM